MKKLLLALAAAAAASNVAAAADSIDWSKFLSRQDLVWHRLPSSWDEMAVKIGVPAGPLAETAARFNELARTGHDDDFNRGDSVYDNYYGDPTLPNPNLYPLGDPPYYAFRIVLGDLGTSGGLRTDEYARVLRADDTVVAGLYAVGNTAAPVMGRSYAGAGATIGPAMTFGFVAAKHVAAQAANQALNSHRR